MYCNIVNILIEVSSAVTKVIISCQDSDLVTDYDCHCYFYSLLENIDIIFYF